MARTVRQWAIKHGALLGARPESPGSTRRMVPCREEPLRMDVDLVLVPVTVSDARNRPVIGLEKQHFALYQDHEKREPPGQMNFPGGLQEKGPASSKLVLLRRSI